MNLAYADAFFRSATLRQAIYYKKEVLKLPYPWTDDQRFCSSRFCNVFRWQDKTTKRILEAANGAIGKLLVYRSVSRISTINYLEKNWDGRSVYGLNLALKEYARNHAVHTGAFFIWPVPGHARWELPGFLLERVSLASVQQAKTIEELTAYFETILGVGPFMAYEYATDISYLRKYPDERTWASAGPGALRGLSRVIYGERRPIDPAIALDAMRILLSRWEAYPIEKTMSEYLEPRYVEDACVPFRSRLTLREVEHWLCEYDKYRRSTPNKRKYP